MPIVLTPRSAPGTMVQLPGPLRLDSGTIVIGRAAGADMIIPHPLVSSRHCAILGSGGSWQLQDSSTNGTLVNGRRVSGSQAIADGDVIGLGDVEIGIRIEGGAATGPGAQVNLQDWRRAGETSGQMPPALIPQAAPGQTFVPAQAPGTVDPVAQLLRAAGLDRNAVQASDQEILMAAGAALRTSVESLASMLQARRKARKELRVAPDPADNPLSQEPFHAALGRLLSSPATAGKLIGDAFGELDRHQRATLGAMQGAFEAALDEFAPESIRPRARDDAAAWQTYEKAFNANDGFVEVFAQALARAYEKLSAK